MSEIKHKDAILDTIDQLRKRKARPDLERICHMLERKHGVNAAETQAILEELVKAGTVYKVDYKGNTSYRNVAKWKGWGTKHYTNSRKISRIIGAAVRATAGMGSPGLLLQRDSGGAQSSGILIPNSLAAGAILGSATSAESRFGPPSVDPANKEVSSPNLDLNGTGASLETISHWLRQSYPDFLQNDLDNLVEHEVEMGHLDRLPNGRLVFCRAPSTNRRSSSTSLSPEGAAPQTVSLSPDALVSPAPSRDNAVGTGIANNILNSFPNVTSTKIEGDKKQKEKKEMKREDVGGIAHSETSNSSTYSMTTERNSTSGTPPAGLTTTTPSPHHVDPSLQQPLSCDVSTKHVDEHLPLSSSTSPGYEVAKNDADCVAMTSRDSLSSEAFYGTKQGTRQLSPGKVKRGRPSTKRKKIKKSLGPDFESYGTVKRCRLEGQSVEGRAGLVVSAGGAYSAGSSEASMDPVCDYCLLGKERNRKGQEEDLLICKDCQAKAHPSCMDYSQDLARRARTSPWQCIDCKTCCICEDAGDPDAMLFCDACDKGYHMSCHSPVVEDKPTGKWICSRCMLELGIESPDHIDSQKTSSTKTDVTPDAGAHGLPTPSASPVQFHDTPVTSAMKINGTIVTPIPKLANTMKAEVPDASEWTVDDVASFFTEVGFPDQAEVLRHQEIDGKSLLLLKRSDVLTGLSFKLGPALKIYAHVQRLQTQGQILL